MIGRRRYRRMLQTLDCRGLWPHARGPPQWAEVHHVHRVNSADPRYEAGPAVVPPAQLKAFSSQPYIRKVWHEPRYIAASDTQGPGRRSFRGKRAPRIPASLAARRRQVSRWKFS